MEGKVIETVVRNANLLDAGLVEIRCLYEIEDVHDDRG
jgi:hypothetical protein